MQDHFSTIPLSLLLLFAILPNLVPSVLAVPPRKTASTHPRPLSDSESDQGFSGRLNSAHVDSSSSSGSERSSARRPFVHPRPDNRGLTTSLDGAIPNAHRLTSPARLAPARRTEAPSAAPEPDADPRAHQQQPQQQQRQRSARAARRAARGSSPQGSSPDGGSPRLGGGVVDRQAQAHRQLRDSMTDLQVRSRAREVTSRRQRRQGRDGGRAPGGAPPPPSSSAHGTDPSSSASHVGGAAAGGGPAPGTAGPSPGSGPPVGRTTRTSGGLAGRRTASGAGSDAREKYKPQGWWNHHSDTE